MPYKDTNLKNSLERERRKLKKQEVDPNYTPSPSTRAVAIEKRQQLLAEREKTPFYPIAEKFLLHHRRDHHSMTASLLSEEEKADREIEKESYAEKNNWDIEQENYHPVTDRKLRSDKGKARTPNSKLLQRGKVTYNVAAE